MALSAGFWLVLVPALIPHILFVLFTVLAYVKWKKKDSISWKAAFVGGVVGTIVLIIAGGVGVYATLPSGLGTLQSAQFYIWLVPFFILSVFATPLAFILLGGIWSSIILFLNKNSGNKNLLTQKLLRSAKVILIFTILALVLYIVVIIRSYS